LPEKSVGKKNAKKKAPRKFAAKTSVKTTQAPAAVPLETFLMLMAGSFLIGLVFLQTDRFQWLGTPVHLPANSLLLFFVVGVLLFGFSFRTLSVSQSAAGDIPRKIAYPLLAVFIAMAMFLGFYETGHPIGHYWDDYAVCIIDPRNILDFHEYHLLFAIGSRDPLYSYVGAFVWWFFPAMKAVTAQRVISNFFSIISLWLLYRVGREISGKRLVGLLIVACFAVSKPVLIQYLTCMPALCLVMAVSLFLLFQIKVFKNPSLNHFLQWGAALAVGLSSYNASRPWIPYLILVTFGWFLWRSKKEKINQAALVAVGAFVFFFFFFYLDRVLAIWHENPIAKIWGYNLGLWFVWQAVFLVVFVWGYLKTQGETRRFYAWGLGLVLLSAMTYPLTMAMDVIQKIALNSQLPTSLSDIFSMKFVNFLKDKLTVAIRCLFLYGDDRSDMNVVPDPFFDYQGAVLAVLGLIGFLVRPSWIKTFVFGSVWVGMIAHLMTRDPTSAKLVGSTPALFLLTAFVLALCLEKFWGTTGQRRWMGYVFAAVLSLFWLWAGQSTFQRVYLKWFDMEGYNSCLAMAAAQDAPDKRVYMGPDPGYGFVSVTSQSVINDGLTIYELQKENLIYVTPSETRQDVVAILSPKSLDIIKQIKKDFPQATWTPGWKPAQSHQEDPYFSRVLISKEQISEKPGKLFQFKVIADNEWKRRLYAVRYGLARGVILKEDMNPTLNPIWPESGDKCVSAEGQWTAPADGEYTFTVSTYDVIKLFVDGQVVFDCIPKDKTITSSHSVSLKKGPHSIQYLVGVRDVAFPQVTIKNSEAHFSQILGTN